MREIGSVFWVLSRGMPGITVVGGRRTVGLKDKSQHHFLGLLAAPAIHCTLNILYPVWVYISRRLSLAAKPTHGQHGTSASWFPAPLLEGTSRTAVVSAVHVEHDLIYTWFMALVDRGAERPLGRERTHVCVCVYACMSAPVLVRFWLVR